MRRRSQAKLNEDTYLSLGKFVVAFSGLVFALEKSTIRLMDLGLDGRRILLAEAALADRTAYPIVNAFFSVFFKFWEGAIPEEDVKIMKRLRKELHDIVEKRNRIMHDAWMGVRVGGDSLPQPMAKLRVRAHGTGVDYESVSYPPSDIEALVSDIERLTNVVNGAVFYDRPGQVGPELHPRIQIYHGKVTRQIDS